MILYHMSDTLKLGDEMALDFKKTMNLAQPFVQALEQSEDCFYAMAGFYHRKPHQFMPSNATVCKGS